MINNKEITLIKGKNEWNYYFTKRYLSDEFEFEISSDTDSFEINFLQLNEKYKLKKGQSIGKIISRDLMELELLLKPI